MRKANLERLLPRRREGIFINPFERGEIGPDLFWAACQMGLGVSPRSTASAVTKRVSRATGLRLRTESTPRRAASYKLPERSAVLAS